jgi:hypothetical protein
VKIKTLLAFLLIAIILISILLPDFAEDYDTNELQVNCDRVSELRDLVETLAEIMYPEYHLSSERQASLDDAQKHMRLRTFDAILHVASEIQMIASRGYYNHEVIVISSFAGSHGSLSGNFYVAFTHERYLELVDLLLEFTGIERDSIVITIEDVIIWETFTQDTCFETIAGTPM